MDSRSEYLRRRKQREASFSELERRDAQLSNVRFLVFFCGVVFALAASYFPSLSFGWLFLPLVAFVILVIVHERVLRRKAKVAGGIRFYERGLERMDGRWMGQGYAGDDLVPEEHPFAADLDLFGTGGLFELLNTVRTRTGEETLAKWLCVPGNAEEIAARQEAVKELQDQLDLREALALAGGEVRAGVRPGYLAAWGVTAPVLNSPGARRMTTGLAAAAVLSFCGGAFWGFGPIPFLLAIAAEMVFARVYRDRVKRVLASIAEPERELRVLVSALQLFEGRKFRSTKLIALQDQFARGEGLASEHVARLERLLTWLDAMRNQLFAPIAFVLLWPIHFAYFLEQWRAEHGPDIGIWLEALGEIEALCALSAYAYENSDDPFPVVREEETMLRARGLGHPLIAGERCVRNDVSLDASTAVLMVSGSNMSGKSTLLRTVGVNAVLAYAGAPVRAEALELSLFSLGASIRVLDSIQSGESRFYSEIRRLHKIMEMTDGERPVLFLLDEILHGTNSHDRGIGAAALLKGLVERGAVGLVTTHDLALTDFTEDSKAVNVHFEDHLEGDALVFDYRLKPGVVQKSNALALMRAIGLKV